MHYLGGITGSGMLMCDGENIARVTYDFDSFRRPSSEIVGNGEITFAVSALKDVFGRDVQISDGRRAASQSQILGKDDGSPRRCGACRRFW